MSEREMAIVLLNMQLDMDYEDCKQYGKLEVDILEKEISELKKRDSSLYFVLENIAERNENTRIFIDGTEEG